MNYEIIKSEFIKLKQEELDYINNIAIISCNKVLSEHEKIEIYRKIINYESRLKKILLNLHREVIKNKKNKKLNDVIIEFDIDKNFLSSILSNNKEYVLELYFKIDIKNNKYKLTLSDIIHICRGHSSINLDIIQNNQKLLEEPIYIFCGYYDSSEDCCGLFLGKLDDYLYGLYENIRNEYDSQIEIPKKKMNDFERNKTIIYSTRYVRPSEIRMIFDEELLNVKNNTLNDCIIKTRNRIEKLNYIRSPEYKEKVLLDRINELYKKVNGELIKKEVLHNSKFFDILNETYKLANGKMINRERIIKNGEKNSIVIIAITQDKEYILTFKNRIKERIIAEFPSAYIEKNENPTEAAKRELQKKTGYISDNLFIVDETISSLEMDNSNTYIVIANNCIKNDEINNTELINYGLFSEIELEYLIKNNIINGAINKLAYYNLINNVDDCDFVDYSNNKKNYKKEKKKANPLYD